MVLISEWLPNPVGDDAKGEWIELRNPGDAPEDLSGWRLTADGKRFFQLRGAIDPGASVVLPRAETKIALKNADGKLALYDPAGHLADHASFIGSAPEGRSANRLPRGNAAVFGKPTPGAPNYISDSGLAAYAGEYRYGTVLNPAMAVRSRFAGHMLGTALALAAALVFILKSHEGISRIFLGGDQGARGRSRKEDN